MSRSLLKKKYSNVSKKCVAQSACPYDKNGRFLRNVSSKTRQLHNVMNQKTFCSIQTGARTSYLEFLTPRSRVLRANLTLGQLQEKLTLQPAMKAHRGSRCRALLFL